MARDNKLFGAERGGAAGHQGDRDPGQHREGDGRVAVDHRTPRLRLRPPQIAEVEDVRCEHAQYRQGPRDVDAGYTHGSIGRHPIIFTYCACPWFSVDTDLGRC